MPGETAMRKTVRAIAFRAIDLARDLGARGRRALYARARASVPMGENPDSAFEVARKALQDAMDGEPLGPSIRRRVADVMMH